MRIACVFVPQLALQSVLRRTPDARGGPVAVLQVGADVADGAGASDKARRKRVARVPEFSPEARREGVRAGMTGAQAAAVCSGLRLLTITAATLRPIQLAFERVPDAAELKRAIDNAAPSDMYLDDVHGSPAHRKHLTHYFAQQIRSELSS